MNAELHLGQAKTHAPVVARHPIATGEGEFETAAEGEAVDGRDRGAGQSSQPVEHVLARVDQLVGLLGGGESGELLDVGPGDKSIGLARAHHDGRRPGALEFRKAVTQLANHIR